MLNVYSIVLSLVSITIQSLIFYYIYNLEAVDCNCITDWRHNFIKFMAVFAILLSLTSILLAEQMKPYIAMAMPILMLLGLINAYAIYTYVGDLQTTNCLCATQRQPKLNKFLYYWRYFLVFCAFFILIALVGMIYIKLTHKSMPMPMKSMKSMKSIKNLSRTATLKAEL